jgi:hypothetical protein
MQSEIPKAHKITDRIISTEHFDEMGFHGIHNLGFQQPDKDLLDYPKKHYTREELTGQKITCTDGIYLHYDQILAQTSL